MNSDSKAEKLKTIKANIKEKNFLSFYYLYGNEGVQISSVKNSIINSFEDPSSLNKKIIKKDNFKFDEIIDYVRSMPFMNDKKLIVFDNVEYFKKSKLDISNGKDENTNNNKDIKNMIDALESSKDINVVVFTYTEYEDKYAKDYSKDNVFYNYFMNNGLAIDFSHLEDSDIKRTIQARFKKSNIDIDNVNLAYLVNICGTDLRNLYNETDKLIAFLGDKKKVDKSDIDEIVTKKLDDRIYTLIDLYNSNKRSTAIKYYGDLISEGETNESIFGVFSYNYASLVVCKDLIMRGKSLNNIAEEMNLEMWRVKKLLDASKYVDLDTLKHKVKKITELSVSKNKGNLNDDAMLLLLMN